MELMDEVKQQMNEEYGEVENDKNKKCYRMLMQKYGVIPAYITDTEKQFLLGKSNGI